MENGTTTIAVLVHKEMDADLASTMQEGQRRALRRVMKQLDPFANGREVAVLAGPTVARSDYARMIAAHFFADVTECEGLLRDGTAGVKDCCGCIDDFLVPQFALVVVLAAADVAKAIADSFAKQTSRPVGEIRIPGMTHVYVV